MKVVWSPLALEVIRQESRYIAAHDRRAARKWIEDLFAVVHQLADFPDSGRNVPELQDRKIREIFHGGYRVIYRVEAQQVSILTVRHSRRHLSSDDLDDR